MNDDPNWPYLESVRLRIGWAVMLFYRNRLRERECEFHADDLRKFVRNKVAIAAPGSADRILRDLRQKGRLNYVILSRRKSLYQFKPIQLELFT